MKLFRRRRPSADRPMDCAEVGKVLQTYLDGHLGPPDDARLVAHLEDCRRCGLEADVYERIKSSLAGPAITVPAESLDQLRAFGENLARGDTSSL